jgi:hypothetical protein
MGALMLLCGFFFFVPVLALIAVVAGLGLLAGIGAGTASLVGGILTYVATASVPGGLLKLLRSR